MREQAYLLVYEGSKQVVLRHPDSGEVLSAGSDCLRSPFTKLPEAQVYGRLRLPEHPERPSPSVIHRLAGPLAALGR